MLTHVLLLPRSMRSNVCRSMRSNLCWLFPPFSCPSAAGCCTQALIAAIEVARKSAEAKEDDPFYPDSFKKEAVPDALTSYQINRDQLTGVKVLGAGQFGRVYLAVQHFGDDATKDVQRAVKLLRDGASLSDKEEFTREAEIMTYLNHPNIVSCAHWLTPTAVIDASSSSNLSVSRVPPTYR